MLAFVSAMLLLALGFQLHFSINSGPSYLRFAKSADLPWLMPVFWIGFNLAMLPAGAGVARYGGLRTIGAAGLLGAIAIIAAMLASDLNWLVAAQAIAGASWGFVLVGAMSAALAIGSTGAEGRVVGLMFSAMAIATFARMAAVWGGLSRSADYAPLLHWTPVVCWALGGAMILALVLSRRAPPARTTA